MRLHTVAVAALLGVAAAAPAYAGGPHTINASCSFFGSSTANPNTLLMVLDGTATTGGEAAAVSTVLTCELVNASDTVVITTTGTNPGPATATVAAQVITNNGPFTVCVTASATWLDGHTAATGRICVSP